jgi:hypothetical protein
LCSFVSFVSSVIVVFVGATFRLFEFSHSSMVYMYCCA